MTPFRADDRLLRVGLRYLRESLAGQNRPANARFRKRTVGWRRDGKGPLTLPQPLLKSPRSAERDS
jgi:hypothetical protein